MTINGEEIETTPWHKFYTTDGWVKAEDLEAGDLIVNLGGVYGIVDSVFIEDATQIMYDLTVEEVHNFAVGDGDWIVHNVNCTVRLQQVSGYVSEWLSKGLHVNAIRNGRPSGELTLLPSSTRQEIFVVPVNSQNTSRGVVFDQGYIDAIQDLVDDPASRQRLIQQVEQMIEDLGENNSGHMRMQDAIRMLEILKHNPPNFNVLRSSMWN